MEPETVRVEESADAAVGRRVHMLMWDRQVKQAELAMQLGIQQSALSKKLRGHRPWSLDELLTAARWLDTTAAYLIGESDEVGRLVHPLGLEPRTHCFSDEHVAEVVSIDSARSLRSWGGEAA